MTTPEIRFRLVHAATEYDRRRSRRRFYNPYALGIMFAAIDATVASIDAGTPVRQALLAHFNDRLLSHLLKAVGEPDFTPEEMR